MVIFVISSPYGCMKAFISATNGTNRFTDFITEECLDQEENVAQLCI